MKLYATVTSERASKSQGGNKIIEIRLQRERDKLTHIIEYTPDGLTVSIVTDSGGAIVYQEKGEKQKGEKCPYCTKYPCSQHDGSKYE